MVPAPQDLSAASSSLPLPPAPGAEDLLSALTRAPGVGVAVTSADARLVYVNEAFCTLVGHPKDDVLGRPFYELIAANERASALASHRAVIAGETRPPTSWALASNGLTEREVQSHSQRLVDEEGRIYRVAMVIDITDTAHSREELRETRALLTSLYDAADAGIAITDSRNRVLTANRAFADFFGRPAAALNGRALDTLVRPTVAETWLTARKRAEHSAEPVREILALCPADKAPDDPEVPVCALSIRAFRDHEDRPVWVNVLTDVTRLRGLEQDLREREERLRLIADSVPAAVALIDGDQRCLFVNRTLRDWFALSDAPVESRPFSALDRPGVYPVLADWLSRVSPGASVVTESANSFPDGATRHVELTIAARMIDNTPAGHYLFAFDITGPKQAQEALRNAKEQAEAASLAKSDFLAKMSHELRTPLNAVIGFSEMMVQEILGPIGNERYRSYARDILISGRHLLELINDVLDLSKIEAGRYELVEGECELIGVIEEAVNLMRLRARNAGLTLETRLAPPVPRLLGDRRMIKQMLLNLLSNAVKFTPSGGSVTISTSRVGDQLVLAVTDTGVGIPEDKLGHLAQPFVQLDSILTRDQEGTGIGLAITKSQIELHGGALRIDSRAGRGTTVSLVFPARRVRQPKAGAAPPGPPPAPTA